MLRVDSKHPGIGRYRFCRARFPVSSKSGLTPVGAIYQNNAHAITFVSPPQPRSWFRAKSHVRLQVFFAHSLVTFNLQTTKLLQIVSRVSECKRSDQKFTWKCWTLCKKSFHPLIIKVIIDLKREQPIIVLLYLNYYIWKPKKVFLWSAITLCTRAEIWAPRNS